MIYGFKLRFLCASVTKDLQYTLYKDDIRMYFLSSFADDSMAGFMAASSHDRWSTTVDYSSMAFVCEKQAGCKLKYHSTFIYSKALTFVKHNPLVHTSQIRVLAVSTTLGECYIIMAM